MFAFIPGCAASLVSRPSAFSGARLSQCAAPTNARFSMVASRSIPFMERPAKLDGTLPGDAGFDPLGFSNMFELNFLREAEVKHGT